jgi:ceramide glucosyltransferase
MTVALAIWALAFFLTLFSTYLTLKHFSVPAPHMDAPFALLPVSILKPLKGRDEGLKDNLESFFKLDYPTYEMIFSVADERDPAVSVVRELIEKYPRVSARLIVGAVDIGTNPKVNNLIRSYDSARHDWLLISDSNVRVASDYLKKMVAHVENGVGIVTSVVAGKGSQGAGGALEGMYLNSFYARGMVLTAVLGHPCVLGKSMLFQRSAMERFGGLKTLSRYLAEDYMAGEAMKRLGLRTVIAANPITQHIGRYSVKEFWLRHLRWGRIRKAQAPVPFLYEPFLGCYVAGAFGAYAALKMFGFNPAEFMMFHLLVWSACDALVMRKMKVQISVSTILAWFLRESFAFPLWAHIALGNTVNWRGKQFMVKQGGILAETHS